ncbi:hypothetical protein [Pedobacter sp. MW01-1-1]|uniref:hypothetical protein n=1 Tax=Pedobacter sp. MW01-1-1 TaxID=3383027 RepID=UPI003FF00E3B
MIKFLTLSIISELACLLVAFFTLYKDKSPFWRSMFYFMVITCCVELVARTMGAVYGLYNTWLFNLYILIEVAVISFGYYYLIKRFTAKAKPVILIGLALVLVVYSVETYSHGIMAYNNITLNVYSTLFVLYGLYYFYLLLKDDDFVQLTVHPEFWWCVGLLFFCFGGTVMNLFNDKFNIKITEHHSIRYYVYNLLNFILYAFWAYSFICRARQRKLQHS